MYRHQTFLLPVKQFVVTEIWPIPRLCSAALTGSIGYGSSRGHRFAVRSRFRLVVSGGVCFFDVVRQQRRVFELIERKRWHWLLSHGWSWRKGIQSGDPSQSRRTHYDVLLLNRF